MEADPQEPGLPYTPSNTGRRARVGYLGFEGVGFDGLWPLFAGLILSISLALRFFLGADAGAGHWLAKTVAAALPLAAGFGDLRFLVQGRPPHFKGDLLRTALALRLDFSDPPVRALPLLPRVFAEASGASGPARSADLRHPMDMLGRRGAGRRD